MLTFGRSPLLPGQLLGLPGPPMTNPQVKNLLDKMQSLDANPALQTSAKTEELDISITNNVTHVYVKVDDPRGLNPRFQGPYPVISHPSRSQVEVKVGVFADGRPRLSTYHWWMCKIAHLRDDFIEASRPNLGRRPDPPVVQPQMTPRQTNFNMAVGTKTENPRGKENNENPAKIQKVFDPLSGRDVHPDYVKKGPIITQDMWDNCSPDIFKNPTDRPVRSTRKKIQSTLIL